MQLFSAQVLLKDICFILFHQLNTEIRDSSILKHTDYNACNHQIYLYTYVHTSCRSNSYFTVVQSSSQCHYYRGIKKIKKKNKPEKGSLE